MGFPVMRRAQVAEAEAVSRLLRDAGRDLQMKGYQNWALPYPLRAIREQAQQGLVWVLEERGEFLATLTLDYDLPAEYQAEWFSQPQASAAYLHRFAVTPSRQGSGLGRLGLREAERITRESGRAWLRFDCYSRNPDLPVFYQRQGCTALRQFEMVLPSLGQPEPFTLFEKQVSEML
ncbi:GNAT family N-acetyltransferase [Deinococcus xinjiangensis]|uniref:GNAT family N-acetyltransferase n=1 Tax=Deinococcus xinjiangensis TaxID=457454 RepID=UPI0033658087